MRPLLALLALPFAALVFPACSDLKEGDNGGGRGADGGTSVAEDGATIPTPSASGTATTPPGGDASTPVGAGPTGPGPFGALPNGYCCTQASECRSRQCVDGPGGKMCLDRCGDADGCLATAGAFTCNGTGFDKLCAPAPATRCIPGNQFARGQKKLGDCCLATHDANAGLECEGGMCGSFGKSGNPYICYQGCAKSADCPGNYMCALGSYDYKICVPESGESLTCK